MVDTRLQRRKDGKGWDWHGDGYGNMGVCMYVAGLGWGDGSFVWPCTAMQAWGDELDEYWSMGLTMGAGK